MSMTYQVRFGNIDFKRMQATPGEVSLTQTHSLDTPLIFHSSLKERGRRMAKKNMLELINSKRSNAGLQKDCEKNFDE